MEVVIVVVFTVYLMNVRGVQPRAASCLVDVHMQAAGLHCQQAYQRYGTE